MSGRRLLVPQSDHRASAAFFSSADPRRHVAEAGEYKTSPVVATHE